MTDDPRLTVLHLVANRWWTGSAEPVLAIAESAVLDSGSRQAVLVDKGEGRFEPREVKIGTQGDGFTQIREGIASGDRVVVAANFLIDAESRINPATRGLRATPAPSPAPAVPAPIPAPASSPTTPPRSAATGAKTPRH